MWHWYLHDHSLHDHCAEFDKPCRIKLLIGSLKDSKGIQEVVDIHANKYEKDTQVNKLNDANGTHGFQNNLLVVPRFAYVLRTESNDNFGPNIDCSNDHGYCHSEHRNFTRIVDPFST